MPLVKERPTSPTLGLEDHNRVTNSKRWFGDNRWDPPLAGAGITEVDRVSPFVGSFMVSSLCLNHRLEHRD